MIEDQFQFEETHIQGGKAGRLFRSHGHSWDLEEVIAIEKEIRCENYLN